MNEIRPTTADEFLDRLPDILRILARIMMEYGVVYQDASDVLRLAFWEEACASEEDEMNISRMAIKTGIARRTVREIAQNRDCPQSMRTMHVANRIVSTWRAHTDYVDAENNPRSLPKKGYKTAGFDDLVQAVRADAPAATVLKFLEENGIVSVEDDHVTLVNNALIPSAGSMAQMDILTANLTAHLKTLLHNITSDPPERRFERALSLRGVPTSMMATLEQEINDRLQDQLDTLFAHIRENYDIPEDEVSDLVVGSYIHHAPKDGPCD